MVRDKNSFPLASRIKAEDMFCNSSPCCNDAGFLQKNNSLDEKSRMVGAFKESAKSQMCDNSERFTRAETDFSNLFARDLLPAKNDPPKCWTSITLTSSWRGWKASTWSCLTNQSHWSRSWWTAETRSSMESEQVILDSSISFHLVWISSVWLENGSPLLPTLTCDHYSIKKAGAVLGFGKENVILLKTDERGRVIPADLEAKIIDAKQKGYVPLFVNATAGTTVYGAFDPINDIADICEKYNLWLHVDGAWGGGLLMSRKHRHKLSGIERANSVTWNPHKMMGVPLQCSAILVREKGILQGCNSMCAGYLFQPDKQYDVTYDTGDKAIQCGRHVDIFKFWLMWKAKGTIGFEQHTDRCLEISEYLYNKIKNRVGYEMVFEGQPQHTNVCFWYIPPSLRGMPHGDERREKLHRVAPKIKAMMMECGTTMVGYQPQGDKVNFFRMVVSNHAVTKSDIDFLIDEIERLGHDL
uniref:Glutamate decarboxylase 1b n=1 Tax=Cyprinus carpio TaxID=7962 RepID=A0A8C1ZID0_CYPCA